MGGCHVKKNIGFLREASEWSKGALFGGRERGGVFQFLDLHNFYIQCQI